MMLTTLLAAVVCASPADAPPRLLVNPLAPQQVPEAEAAAFTDAVVSTLSSRGLFDVVSARDVQTMLGVERQRALVGACQDDGAGCGKDELQSAMSVRFLLTGQLAKVGNAFQLTLQLLDLTSSRAASRSSRLANSLDALRAQIPWAAAEATGSPLPPPPTRVWQVSMMVVGGAAVLAGGAYGVLTLSRQSQLNDELCPGGVSSDGRCSGVNLRPRQFYQQQDQALAVQKAVSIAIMVAGAALAGVGFWLLPPDDPRTRISAVLLPSLNGVSIAGAF
jgi:TolB-like protein